MKKWRVYIQYSTNPSHIMYLPQCFSYMISKSRLTNTIQDSHQRLPRSLYSQPSLQNPKQTTLNVTVPLSNYFQPIRSYTRLYSKLVPLVSNWKKFSVYITDILRTQLKQYVHHINMESNMELLHKPLWMLHFWKHYTTQ